MPDVAETLKVAVRILDESEIVDPRREAVSLLCLALKKDKTFLFAHGDYQLSDGETSLFQEYLRRRASREPLQYIRGSQEFYGLDFIVTPNVLIPRPETELIAENAIKILNDIENPRFCEVGVGSGCISISILHEVKNALGIGLDISAKALKISAVNAANHLVSDRITLEVSDVFSFLQSDFFDLIVSNPPYISSEEIKELQPEVKVFEPLTALTDGRDGLSIIEKIILNAPRFLRNEGYLLMEIGFGQSEKVSAMFDPAIWKDVEFVPDLQGVPRMVKARTANNKS